MAGDRLWQTYISSTSRLSEMSGCAPTCKIYTHMNSLCQHMYISLYGMQLPQMYFKIFSICTPIHSNVWKMHILLGFFIATKVNHIT